MLLSTANAGLYSPLSVSNPVGQLAVGEVAAGLLYPQRPQDGGFEGIEEGSTRDGLEHRAGDIEAKAAVRETLVGSKDQWIGFEHPQPCANTREVRHPCNPVPRQAPAPPKREWRTSGQARSLYCQSVARACRPLRFDRHYRHGHVPEYFLDLELGKAGQGTIWAFVFGDELVLVGEMDGGVRREAAENHGAVRPAEVARPAAEGPASERAPGIRPAAIGCSEKRLASAATSSRYPIPRCPCWDGTAFIRPGALRRGAANC